MISILCGDIIPDFLVHNPGNMGVDDNLVIVEVKTIQGANYNHEGKDLLKDMETVSCMTTIKNGYHRGIILIFGAENDKKKGEIIEIYKQICNPEKVLLLFHEAPDQKAKSI